MTSVLDRDALLDEMLSEMASSDPAVATTPIGIDSEGGEFKAAWELWVLHQYRGETLG